MNKQKYKKEEIKIKNRYKKQKHLKIKKEIKKISKKFFR